MIIHLWGGPPCPPQQCVRGNWPAGRRTPWNGRFLIALILLACATAVDAHEVRPAYLELKQTGGETFDVFWKVPGRGDMRLGLYVQVPQNCKPVSLQNRYGTGDAFIERWTLKCESGLVGRTIAVEGLSSTITDVLVRLERLDGTMQATRLSPTAPSFVVEAAPKSHQVALTYLRLGVEHILTGLDHLLFVLSLLLIAKEFKLLFKTVTAFTIAHSITLGLATLGFVHVQPAPVEAVIALSIVFVASEILHLRQDRVGLAARAPWIVAFVFGLLHGFGFAGALTQIGLPARHIPTALFCFNMGVEFGQILFITAIIALIWPLKRLRSLLPHWAELVPPYAIGTAAMFWVIQRIAAF